MNIFVFFVFSVCGWYSKLWALTFACFFSFLELYFSCWGLEKCSFYIFQDSMSLSLVSLSFWVTMMMMLASQSSVKLKDNSVFFFSQVLLVLNLIVVLCFCVSSVIFFYFFFEASLIPTLVLILGWGYQPERLQAGMYMMIYTIGASLPLLLVIVWFNYMICSSDIMVVNLCRGNFFVDLVVDFLAFLIFSAFLVKLPLFSVHLWLPKAHVEAPVAGSMVLAAILLKLGGYGLLRMHQYFNFFGCNFSVFISVLALWGGIMTSIICFRQVDFKSLVAYSSIGHMSLIVAGVFSNSVWGWMGSLVVMISHGFSSSGLFVLSNLSYEKTNSRSLFLSKGLLMLTPNLAMWWFLFCCMNMAAPPSINLFGEIIIFFSVIFSSWFYVGCVGFMSFLAAFYSMYLYVCMQHGGGPKYLSFSKSMDSFNYDLLILHWLPGNLFILKNELVLLWF